MRSRLLRHILGLLGAGTLMGLALACDGTPATADMEVLATFGTPTFNEPSGLVYHPTRRTLFAVGDEGDVGEFSLDGTLLRQVHLMNASFEGIALDPAQDRLYVAIEGDDDILEIEVDALVALRTFSVKRKFEGQTVIKKNRNGFEGLAFVTDPTHSNGGALYVSNQVLNHDDAEDLSAVFELDHTTDPREATIRRVLRQETLDLAGLVFDAQSGHLWAISDQGDQLLHLTLDGQVVATYRLPGTTQEGIALGPDGTIYIAQDTGGLLHLRLK